jgi:septum formation protein
MCDLILASGSSRRHSLLKKLNLEYRVVIPNVDETVYRCELATQYVTRIAIQKARSAYESSVPVTDEKPVLAADTIIVLNGEIMGKPSDMQHAKHILKKLSAKEHEVLTALCLKVQDHMFESIVTTKVKFKHLANAQINAYCLTDEPYDKAGAYAIQGLGANFIEYILGSYSNVMGLPLYKVCNLLKQAKLFGYDDI